MQDSTPNGVSNRVPFLTKISFRKTTLAKADLVNVSKELNSILFYKFMKGPHFWIPLRKNDEEEQTIIALTHIEQMDYITVVQMLKLHLKWAI